MQLSSAIPAGKLNDQDCLFLGGVQLHLCCCKPEEQLQLVRIAREGCALRHTDLSQGLTHIVVRPLLLFVCDVGMRADLRSRSGWHINASHMCETTREIATAELQLLTCTYPPLSTAYIWAVEVQLQFSCTQTCTLHASSGWLSRYCILWSACYAVGTMEVMRQCLMLRLLLYASL